MKETTLKRFISIERSIINGVTFLPVFIHWCRHEIKWKLGPRGKMSLLKIHSVEDIEWGCIYYIRATPFNTGGFSVYLPNEYFTPEYAPEDDTSELNEIDLSDSTLEGKDNWEWTALQKAKEKGYPIDDETSYSIMESYPHMSELSAEQITDSEWIRDNVPEEYQEVLTDIGIDGIKPATNGRTSRKYLATLIARGALYRLTDKIIREELETLGLFDSLEKWEFTKNRSPERDGG